MSSTIFFFVFIPLLAVILLAVNLIFAPHNPYQEKDSVFECGFHSFLGQNRSQFNISFFIYALLFLLMDLEILLVYPYIVSAYSNGVYGLVIMLVFFLALTLGFAFELGKGALKTESRQQSQSIPNFNLTPYEFYGLMKIKPVKFTLPIVDKEEYLNLVGKNTLRSRGDKGVAGIYNNTNISNGYTYVFSVSIFDNPPFFPPAPPPTPEPKPESGSGS